MPVIVVGADTRIGRAAIDALLPAAGELRAFVTSEDEAGALKQRGVKVAIGDISDGSHVGGAALNAFCAVLSSEAAVDDRERSFADTPDAVVEAWIEGLADAGVTRVIWVDHPSITLDVEERLSRAVQEARTVAAGGREPESVAAEIARWEALANW